jgi:lipid-binding SYLF domain-containing protein
MATARSHDHEPTGMDHLLSAKFQIRADASAAAGPIGRHAAAGTDWKMETEILSYARARGVFAGCVVRWSDPASRSGSHNNRVRQGASAPRNPEWESSTS